MAERTPLQLAKDALAQAGDPAVFGSLRWWRTTAVLLARHIVDIEEERLAQTAAPNK